MLHRLIKILFLLSLVGGVLFSGLLLYHRFFPGEFKVDPTVPVNPEKRYTVTLWEFAYPTPGTGPGYPEFLQDVLREFRLRYPNIEVKVEYIPENEIKARLLEALSRGNPPDLCSWTGYPFTGNTLQIPLNGFLPPEAWADFGFVYPTDRKTKEPALFGWPRYATPLLIAANPDHFAKAGIDWRVIQQQGWTYAHWLKAFHLIHDNTGSLGMYFHQAPTLAFPAFLAGTGLTSSPLTAQGEINWDKEMIGYVAASFEALLREELTLKDAEQMEKRLLTDFFEGQTAAMGPIQPWLGPIAARRATVRENAVKPVFLPFPHHPDRAEAAPGMRTYYLVFRTRPYKGHDHTKGVMELARFLTEKTALWPGTQYWTVPEYRPLRTTWLEKINSRENGEFLVRYADTMKEVLATERAQKALETVYLPIFQEFWQGKLDAFAVRKKVEERLADFTK